MKGAKVLVIDDERQIRRALQLALSGSGYAVQTAATGAEGLDVLNSNPPDIVLLDLGLPDIDGLEMCRRIRVQSVVPIIVLSVRGEEQTKVAAFDLGADDYLTKPFGMDELLARIRVALRHATGASGTGAVLTFGDLSIDLAKRQVVVHGQEVKLTPTEFDVLKYLALHAGQVVTHRMLLQAVWGPDYQAETQYLRVFIGQLRRKIEPVPARPVYLLTDPGVGYRFRAADETR